MKAQIHDTTAIRSNKSRMVPTLTRKGFMTIFESSAEDKDKSEPKDLFKTFEK